MCDKAIDHIDSAIKGIDGVQDELSFQWEKDEINKASANTIIEKQSRLLTKVVSKLITVDKSTREANFDSVAKDILQYHLIDFFNDCIDTNQKLLTLYQKRYDEKPSDEIKKKIADVKADLQTFKVLLQHSKRWYKKTCKKHLGKPAEDQD